MKTRPTARHAYVEAEVTTALAHQIKAIRMQRDWTQSDLARLLGTTQTVVSRLEDPSYGRYTLKTLMDLAKVFDVGMQVRFVSFVTMLHETLVPNPECREVTSFEEEAPNVAFYKVGGKAESATYIAALAIEVKPLTPYHHIVIPRPSSRLVSLEF